MDSKFIEGKDTLIGTINIDSGILLITDGIFDSNNVPSPSKQKIEFGEETAVKLKLFAAKQAGKRYLIIPLDTAQDISKNTKDEVVVVEGSDADVDTKNTSKE